MTKLHFIAIFIAKQVNFCNFVALDNSHNLF